RKAHPTLRPLWSTVARLTVRRDEQTASGGNVRAVFERRNRRANPELHEGLQRIPSAHAADFQLIPIRTCHWCQVNHVWILADPVGQHDDAGSTRDRPNVAFKVFLFVAFGGPVEYALFGS